MQKDPDRKEDQENAQFLKAHSGMKVTAICKKIGLKGTPQFYTVYNGNGGFAPDTRVLVRQLVDETRVRRAQTPKQLKFEIGSSIEITAPNAAISMNVVQRSETVWMVEVRLKESLTK